MSPQTGQTDEMTYESIVFRFTSYSTIHGIPHILTARGWIKRLLWISLTLACTGGFVFNFYSLTKNYLDYSVYVKIDVLNLRQLAFPAVSICNTNPVKKSAVGLSAELESLLEHWEEGEQVGTGRRRRRRKREACPNAEEPTSGICYWKSSESFTFDEAQQHCIDEGATLAIVDSQEKFDYLFDTLGFYSTWINLQYNSGAGEWQWGDGTALSWSNWESDPGSPPSDADKTCVFVSFFAKTVWKNENCNGPEVNGSPYQLKAICMVDISSATDSITTESSPVAEETTTADPSPEVTTTFFSSFPEREVIREDFKKETDFIETLADIPLEEKKAMGYNFSEFILSSMYNGKECNQTVLYPELTVQSMHCRAFGYFYHAVHGNCYVFNSGWASSQAVLNTSYIGRRQGLHILLNIGQHEYLEGVTESAGAVVVVHDQFRMPFPEDEGVLAKPGYVTSIGVKRTDVERLGTQYSNCIEANRNQSINVFAEHYPVNYSIAACQKTCYQKHLIASCGCGDPQYPIDGTALGSGQAEFCDIRNNVQDDCVYGVTLQFINDELDCDCPVPCQDTLYAYKISRMMWPMEKNEQTILDTYYDQISDMLAYSGDQQFFRRNLLKVEVYFEELNRETVEEKPKYPLVRYMSDVGAIIGLWIGCSVLSLIEFGEFIIHFIVLMFKKISSHKSSLVKDTTKNKKTKKTRKRKVTPEPDRRPARKSQSTVMKEDGSVFQRPTARRQIKQETIPEHQSHAWSSYYDESPRVGTNILYL